MYLLWSKAVSPDFQYIFVFHQANNFRNKFGGLINVKDVKTEQKLIKMPNTITIIK